MPVIACPECGAKVSDIAKTCPACGTMIAMRGNRVFRRWFVILAVIGLIAWLAVERFA